MAIAFIRTIILYLLLTVGIRIMGKKQVGELETVELVFTMLISDLAAVPMQDFGIPLAYGLIPILTLFSLTSPSRAFPCAASSAAAPVSSSTTG